MYLASYSWIGMKAASTPQGLAAAPSVKLFGGFLLKSDGQNAGSPAFAPIAGAPQIALDTKHAELSNCVFGEPGMMATGSGLYLSFTCHLLGPSVQPYIVLFHCANPCSIANAANWAYLGRLITPADAQAIDPKYSGLSAPSLFEKAGTTYLIATPVEPVGSDTRYDGCRVYRFTNLTTGQLERSAGQLVTVQRVDGIAGTHHGACGHHANHVGIIYSQLVTAEPPQIFRLYQSWVDVP